MDDLRHQMDFEAGLGGNGAGLARDPRDQLVLVGFEQVGRLAQDRRAFLVGRGGPFLLRLARLGGGGADIGGIGVADAGENLAIGRFEHVERAARRRAPFGAEHTLVPGLLD